MDLGKIALLAGGAYVGYKLFLEPSSTGGGSAAPAVTLPGATPGLPSSVQAQLPPGFAYSATGGIVQVPVNVATVSTGPATITTGQSLIGPPPPTNPCSGGFTLDAGNVCVRYADAQLLANLNSIQWTGPGDVPTEQINRIDPLILSRYASETNVNPGTVLAYMLGLGGPSIAGTFRTGSDGNKYQYSGSAWIRSTAGLSGAGRMPANFRRANVQMQTTIRRPGVSTLARLGAAIPAARVMPRSSRYLAVRGR